MKFIISILLISWANLVLSNSTIRKYRSVIETGQLTLKWTREVLEAALRVAEEYHVDVQMEHLIAEKDEVKEFPVLRILPSQSSEANQEALRLHRDYGGLPLYLSPYDLKRSGAHAFFKVDGSMIGVPFDFIYDPQSASYKHELYHATTFLNLIRNGEDRFAGFYKRTGLGLMSPRNNGGYQNMASIDEMLATELSVVLEMTELYHNYKSQKDFFERKDNEEILSNIDNSLKDLIGLTYLAEDLMTEALKAFESEQYTVNQMRMNLGSDLSRDIYNITFRVNAWDRQFIKGKGHFVPVPEGNQVTFYSLEQDKNFVLQKLITISKEAQRIRGQYQNSRSHIYKLVERVVLDRTDIQALWNSIALK